MATQTKTQRQAAAKKAAATRKRNAANRSASAAKSSARSTSRSARTTAKQAARTTGKRASAETTGLQGLARRAQRAVLIPIGVALEAGDRVVDTARTYGDRTKAKRRFDRFERRGEQAFRRNRRTLEREARDLRREVERTADRTTSDAAQRFRRVTS
jgi:hypothetical protein